MLVIRRVHVTYRLRTSADNRDTVERVHEMHCDYCPVYRTLKSAIEITTSYEIEAEA